MLLSEIYRVEIPLVPLPRDQQISPPLVVSRSGFADACAEALRGKNSRFQSVLSAVKASGARNSRSAMRRRSSRQDDPAPPNGTPTPGIKFLIHGL